MSSTKGTKQPSLDALLDLGDLLGTGATGDGLGALLSDDSGDVGDPLAGIDYENSSNEEVVQQEESALLAAFKLRAKREQERFALATDSEYWVAVCFQTRAQKEFFLEAVRMLQAGDKYIDGQLLAKRMGVTLPAADVPYNVSARPDVKLAALVRKETA